MTIDLDSGKYVVAVSGGVDSMVLLDLLLKSTKRYELIVAHFDHGIREDSPADLKFVEALAKSHKLQFVSQRANLGSGVSEEVARTARYTFLNQVAKDNGAEAIVLAHHQDDLLETAIINIIRGTGRRGLSSLSDSKTIRRPLLKYPKADLIKYAKDNNLDWHEDSTNKDTKYLRNYIRLKIIPKIEGANRHKLLKILEEQQVLNNQIDNQLSGLLIQMLNDEAELPRLWLNSLDYGLSREVIAAWLRRSELYQYDSAILSRLAVGLKVAKPGREIDVFSDWHVKVSSDYLALAPIER